MTCGKAHRSLAVISGEPDPDLNSKERAVSGAAPHQVESGGKERRGSLDFPASMGINRGDRQSPQEIPKKQEAESHKDKEILPVNTASPKRTGTFVPQCSLFLDSSVCRFLQASPIHPPPKSAEDRGQPTKQKGAHRAMLLGGVNPNLASRTHICHEVTPSMMELWAPLPVQDQSPVFSDFFPNQNRCLPPFTYAILTELSSYIPPHCDLFLKQNPKFSTALG